MIAITPLCGALSDRVGRRPMLLGLTLLAALLPSLFAWMAQAPPLGIALAAVLLACVAGGVSAVAAPATAEQFPAKGG